MNVNGNSLSCFQCIPHPLLFHFLYNQCKYEYVLSSFLLSIHAWRSSAVMPSHSLSRSKANSLLFRFLPHHSTQHSILYAFTCSCFCFLFNVLESRGKQHHQIRTSPIVSSRASPSSTAFSPPFHSNYGNCPSKSKIGWKW